MFAHPEDYLPFRIVAGGQMRAERTVMKLLVAAGILAAASSLSGCASNGTWLVLDPVGPPPLATADEASTGMLMVYSACEQGAEFNSPYYRRQYSDYTILSADGRLLQAVHNDSGTLTEAPKRVQLPLGTYRIVARANSYGEVIVPVVIRANQVTTVHLEGSPAWPNGRELAKSNPVCLPDGEIAGWRATTGSSSKP
jgi:hypothetical protein